MSLRDSQREAAIRAILDAATAVFAERGYHGASMEDLARACDCAPATLYGYFKGKRELFARMLADHGESYLTGVARALERADGFRAGFDAYVQHFAHWGQSNRDFLRLLLTVMREPTGGHPDPDGAEQARIAYSGMIQGLVQRGLDEGQLQPARPEVLAASLSGLLHSNAWRWMFDEDPSDLGEIVKTAARLFLEGASQPTGGV